MRDVFTNRQNTIGVHRTAQDLLYVCRDVGFVKKAAADMSYSAIDVSSDTEWFYQCGKLMVCVGPVGWSTTGYKEHPFPDQKLRNVFLGRRFATSCMEVTFDEYDEFLLSLIHI